MTGEQRNLDWRFVQNPATVSSLNRPGARKLDNVIRVIPVRDANGDELTLFEYEIIAPPLAKLGLNRSGGTKRLALETGEAVNSVDDDHFVVVSTGERLTRIE